MAGVGKVYLVGAGPGDPGLLTLKGQRCLAEADVVVYDGLVNPLLLRHSRADAVRTCRVGSGSEKHLVQEEINQQLVAYGLAGKTVVRLKGGDPFIFGRGSEEAAALAAAGVPFEVVPGVTAATAAAVYAGISLTHRELASAVAFVTGHEDPAKPETSLDYEVLAKFPGTLVFYMGLHRLPQIAARLQQHGKPSGTPVAVISRGSTPLQRTITGPLGEIAALVAQAKLHAPSLIIVGDCVTQRDTINWFEKLPLAGISIGITRPEGHADNAIELALALGAQPVLMPTIQIEPLTDWTEVDAALDSIAQYDWLVFTSVVGVDALLGRLWSRGDDARKLSHVKLAAIGPATAERLHAYRLRADLVPDEFRGEALAAALAPHVRGKKVLWARASRGREVLPEQLTAAGADFKTVVAYDHVDVETYPTTVQQLLADGDLQWIALSSPSIARNVAKLIPPSQRQAVKFAAISPVTEQAAIESGLEIAVVAKEYTWQGLFDAIRDAHRKRL
ncbi:uroporphyrinogen-III C-methyltransferase [Planctomicrobium piriforme]|uniref:uroporphyrinogen-III C-methyltransferase n=1 Tax=Planctomicrobium piriforme TaxID=1576369 RepID=A0A1I3L0G7_9PLAN|nr:uroporphyrinogen-III C-methyltransferase [Planctomicrobium piriforme]SFI78098.1 uroporphyrinogen III methyltransferase / synthase [Planctomicrobium piriforme]